MLTETCRESSGTPPSLSRTHVHTHTPLVSARPEFSHPTKQLLAKKQNLMPVCSGGRTHVFQAGLKLTL